MLDGSTEFFAARAITLSALGGAYLAFLANVAATIAFFIGARSWLVISPNRAAKHYGLYVVMALMGLIVATVLENELVPRGDATLEYAVLPQLLLLAMIHLWLYYDQQPWLVALGAAANLGAIVTVSAAAAVAGNSVHAAHGWSVVVLGGLLAYLARCSISTKRGFVNAKSIYASSKEAVDARRMPQTPWLGLTQWVALGAASLALSTANAVLRGGEIANIPAVEVASDSGLMLGVTLAIGAIPAATYWLAHKNWMPELTRLVWLVWLVVGFAFTYSNVLTSLDRA